MERKQILVSAPLFKEVLPQDLSVLTRQCRELKVKSGKLLCRENEAAEYLFLVVSGAVKLVKETRTGKKSMINTIRPGHLFGEEAFLSGSPYEYSAEAHGNTTVIRIPHKTMHELIKENPNLSMQLSLGLCQKLRSAHTQLVKEKRKNITVTIHNDGDLKTKAWFALELALSFNDQFKKKVLLLDLATQNPSMSDILNLKKPYDYIVINLPKHKNAFTETVLKYSTHVLNLSKKKLAFENAMEIKIPKEKDHREWYIGHIARRIAKRTIGLALGSGTTGGLTHIGVFKALEKLKIPVDMIAGTSGGALYGVMWAAGKSGGQIEEIIIENSKKPLFMHLRPSFSMTGLFSAKNLIDQLMKFIKKSYFSELKIPLRIIATDLKKHRPIIFENGSFLKAIQGSIAIPIIFQIEKNKDQQLSDGAAVNPLPVDVLREAGMDFIIASYPTQKKILKENPRNALEVFLTARNITNDVIALNSGKKADVFINPDTSKYGLFEYSKAQNIIRIGEKEAYTILNKLACK